MRFITTTDAGDLELAIGHLQRAIELDPELADPYVWLSYDYSRLGIGWFRILAHLGKACAFYALPCGPKRPRGWKRLAP